MRGRGALGWLFLVVGLIVGACGIGVPSPVPTSCGGSHEWPPNGYESLSLPLGVVVEPAGPTTIRVRNGSTQAWTFETAIWVDNGCVGFIAETLPRSLIGPGHQVESQFDPHDPNVDPKITVAVYAPDCDDTCTDPPVGFGWIDVVGSAPS